MPTIYLATAISAVCFLAGAWSGWTIQGGIKDRIIVDQMVATAEAVQVQVEKQKTIQATRAARWQLSQELAAANQAAAAQHNQKVTEARVEYVTEDVNASNCGFSIRGVHVWNQAARGGGMFTSTPPSAVDNAGSITADNAQIVTAAEISFARHWDAIRQVDQLRAWILDQCAPLAPTE